MPVFTIAAAVLVIYICLCGCVCAHTTEDLKSFLFKVPANFLGYAF